MNDKNVFSRLAYLLHRSRQSVEKRHRTLRKKEEEDDSEFIVLVSGFSMQLSIGKFLKIL